MQRDIEIEFKIREIKRIMQVGIMYFTMKIDIT